MSLFAIADLHLSFSSDKPMDIYGGWWINHTETLKNNWLSMIQDEDTVLIPGDISWALRLDEAKADLEWLSDLPGHKVLIKGNHDLWWTSIGRLSSMYRDLEFIQNSSAEYGEYAICGTRGWICPGENNFDAHDEKIYKRELIRLEMSFEAASKKGCKKFIGMLHYPPANEKMEPSGFTELFAYYGTEKVVYGHLHGRDAYENGPKGIIKGVEYFLVSCDHLQCMPLKIL